MINDWQADIYDHTLSHLRGWPLIGVLVGAVLSGACVRVDKCASYSKDED
jgi:hypothetical protein